MALRQRLRRDIMQLEEKPYPNIKFVCRENDMTKACLILTPEDNIPLHLTADFADNYPLRPPRVTIQTHLVHPNVFDGYICATILNKTEGYTPAYDLKGICIQLLSFFAGESIEQDYGNRTIDLRAYRDIHARYLERSHVCDHCQFGVGVTGRLNPGLTTLGTYFREESYLRGNRARTTSSRSADSVSPAGQSDTPTTQLRDAPIVTQPRDDRVRTGLVDLPDELLVLVCDHLEPEELAPLSQAWDRVGGQNRELICFCLKKGLDETELGIGVEIKSRGRGGAFESEFDLLSLQAFEDFKIRRSVQGLSFSYWLPLPISRRHYARVREEVTLRLRLLSETARLPDTSLADVIYAFMNDIVVRLSTQAESGYNKSSLVHASEKAIESYYHLFHLLLCLATENRAYVRSANNTIKKFLIEGKTSKSYIPNLGHLLVAVLISDATVTSDLLMAIVRETVTRNVVWTLDKKGANMPELAYMEADTISHYRLQKTFDASKTSYRLLMFLNLFRRSINRGSKSLIQLREELFNAHGAPPQGTAARLANDIKTLQTVKNFPEFIKIMGLTPPSASRFTSFLRNCVEESMRKGYSVWGISQTKALTLRQQVDPTVQVRKEQNSEWRARLDGRQGFFPGKDARR